MAFKSFGMYYAEGKEVYHLSYFISSKPLNLMTNVTGAGHEREQEVLAEPGSTWLSKFYLPITQYHLSFKEYEGRH